MTTFLAKLNSRGSLTLTGADARTFLQGQTTCNLDELSADRSLVGAYCNPQGRMICDFRLWQLAEDQVLMGLEADTVDTALATFGKYVVFSKATLDNATADYVHYALWGDQAAELAQAAGAAQHESWQRDGVIWTRTEIDGVFEACVSTAVQDQFEAAMAGCDSVDETAYRRLEIAAGLGHVTLATSAMFLPQMLNYQHTGRISFNKGCYTGQEVVARMHYRGKVKRPMLLALAQISDTPEPGAALYQSGSGKSVGNVVASSFEGDAVVLLANVARDAVETGVSLAPDGPTLSFSEPPYALESA